MTGMVKDCDIASCPGQFQSRGSADASGSARYQGYFPVKWWFVHTLRFLEFIKLIPKGKLNSTLEAADSGI
jgi:hypothetical protein